MRKAAVRARALADAILRIFINKLQIGLGRG